MQKTHPDSGMVRISVVAVLHQSANEMVSGQEQVPVHKPFLQNFIENLVNIW